MKYMYIAMTALTGLLVLGPAHAEEAAAEESYSPWSNTLTVGYDSRYVLYGYRGGHSLFHADLWTTYYLNDKVTLVGGFWYGTQPDGTYNELDLYAGFDYALSERLYAGFMYSIFNYFEVPFETSGESHEFAVHLSYWGDQFSLQLRNQYDTEAEGSIARIIGGYTLPLCEQASLQLEAEAGYAFEYYIEGNLWNHALVKASLPSQVSEAVSVSPFITRSIPLAAIDSFEEYETVYGVNVSVSF